MGKFNEIVALFEELETMRITRLVSNDRKYGVDKIYEESLQLVCEQTFKINKEVNMLFDTHLAPLLQRYKTAPDSVWLKTGEVSQTDSSVFTQGVLKDAHEVNPITIHFGVLQGGNHYNPKNKKIQVTLHTQAMDFLGPKGLENKEAVEQEPNVIFEFTPEKLKATIAHELTHWIEDSLFENKIKRALDTLHKKVDNEKDFSQKKKIITQFQRFSEHEIQAHINGLSAIRDNNPELYDSWSWKELQQNSPALKNVVDNSKELPDDERRVFMKQLLRRLSRENLLTKRMIEDINQ